MGLCLWAESWVTVEGMDNAIVQWYRSWGRALPEVSTPGVLFIMGSEYVCFCYTAIQGPENPITTCQCPFPYILVVTPRIDPF